MELAGNVHGEFRIKMAGAKLTLVLDGEYVMRNVPVGQFMGSLAGEVPSKTPFEFRDVNRRCLFTAHQIQGGDLEKGLERDDAPVGYFLPIGTQIRATIEGAPEIPPGVEVLIGGLGSHYTPDQLGARGPVSCPSIGSCKT